MINMNENKYNYYLATLVGMGGFSDGFALLLASGALLTLGPYFHLSSSETGLIISAPFIGSIIGSLMFGRLSDIFGRRVIFLNVLLFFVLGSILSAIATFPLMLVASRFLVGIGIGGDIPAGGSLITEVSKKESRGKLVTMQSLLWGLGGASAVIIAIPLLTLGPASWRYILGIGSIPPLIVLFLRREIGESHLWISNKKKDKLTSFQIDNRKYLIKLIFVALALFVWTFILAIFASYTPTFLSQIEKLPHTTSLLIAGFQWIGFVMGSAFVFKYVDKIGRRPLMIYSSISIATFLFLGYMIASSNVNLFIILILSMWILGGIGYTVSTIYSNELFPTIIRSTSSGIGFATGRFGGYISTLIFPSLLLALGLPPIFLILVPLPMLIALTGIPFAPNSEGKNLEELEKEIKK
ncbi:MAG: MFS transporter [Conexivisphaerales archaeon]